MHYYNACTHINPCKMLHVHVLCFALFYSHLHCTHCKKAISYKRMASKVRGYPLNKIPTQKNYHVYGNKKNE